MSQHMSKVDYLEVHLKLAIANDSQPKQNAADYPGYWLFVAGEYLKPKSYKRLLDNLNLSEFDVHSYKFLFTMDVYNLLQQEDKQQSNHHPNCRCDMTPLDEQEDRPA